MEKDKKILARLGKISLIGAALIGLLNPIVFYWGLFSGDAEIHLVYAQNLLRGYPLQFNLHMPNSGETSMGFMLVDTLILRVFGAVLAPLVIELFCLLSLYATAFITLLIGRAVGVRRPWREIAAICFLWMPGNAYTSMYGTENVLFAALSGLFVWSSIRANWYHQEGPATAVADGLLGLYAGCLFWLRPEAAPLVVILLFVRAIAVIAFKRKLGHEAKRATAFVLAFSICVLAYIVIFKHFAGEMPYGAGKARRLLSIYKESHWFHGVPVNLKVVTRAASYFTIVLPALTMGVVAIARRSFPPALRLKILVFAGVCFSFLAAYVFNVLPAVHFARYSVFIWPYALILAVLGLQCIQDAKRLSPTVWAIGLTAWFLCFAGIVAYETKLRIELAGPNLSANLRDVERAPQDRERKSANMAAHLGLPVGASANLAYQEVQARYGLTDNFIIISLDGITDSRLLPYFCGKWVDHEGYLIDTKVDYLMELNDYNADKSRWSLDSLKALPLGHSLLRPGILYTRIQPDVVRVQRTVGSASDRPGGTCSEAN